MEEAESQEELPKSSRVAAFIASGGDFQPRNYSRWVVGTAGKGTSSTTKGTYPGGGGVCQSCRSELPQPLLPFYNGHSVAQLVRAWRKHEDAKATAGGFGLIDTGAVSTS
jgi:hypothetical protein